MDRIINEVTNLGSKSLAVFTLSLITAIGCLPRNQQMDQMYDGGSNLTSVTIEAPRNKKLAYNQMALRLRVVDNAGNDTDSVVKSAIDIPEGSETAKSELTVYSNKYKVALDFVNVADGAAEPKVVASSGYCKDPKHIETNSKIQNIVGDNYSLEIFVCTPDGTENVKTEKNTTAVGIKPELVIDSGEEILTPELSLDKLEQGQQYIFKVKSDDAEFGDYSGTMGRCLLSKEQEIKAVYLGTANASEQSHYIRPLENVDGKDVEGKETDCPSAGQIKVKDVGVKPLTTLI